MRAATGRDSGELQSESWDVRDLRGKEAHLEIMDAGTGALPARKFAEEECRDHLLVDQIISSGSPDVPDEMKHGFDPDDPAMAREVAPLAPTL